jgi:hypothetical protein
MALNGAYQNKKVRRLARELKIIPAFALGVMEAFWLWVRDAARAGRIEPDQWEDIAEHLQWQDTAENLRAMLVRVGFIDEMAGWDWVHDWHQHADDTVRKSLERYHRTFANGQEPRSWKKANELRVETKPQFVETKQGFGESSRARVLPEPEPVPVPAAAARARRAPARENPPPAAAEDLASIAAAIAACTTPVPHRKLDPGLVKSARAAAPHLTPDEIAAWIHARTRERGRKVDSYGFWPVVLPNAQSPPTQKLQRSQPKCQRCRDEGWIFNWRNDAEFAAFLGRDEVTDAEVEMQKIPCPQCSPCSRCDGSGEVFGGSESELSALIAEADGHRVRGNRKQADKIHAQIESRKIPCPQCKPQELTHAAKTRVR